MEVNFEIIILGGPFMICEQSTLYQTNAHDSLKEKKKEGLYFYRGH